MSSSSSRYLIRAVRLAAILGLSLSLGACDYAEKYRRFRQTPEEAKAEGIALGAGCRQVGQSLEDCYQRNPNGLKAGIFAGWKDMHEYMASKNIETVLPPVPPPPPVPELTDEEKAAAAKDAAAKDAPVDDRAARREKRERERAEREAGSKSASKSSDSDTVKDSKSKASDSTRKSREDSSSSKN